MEAVIPNGEHDGRERAEMYRVRTLPSVLHGTHFETMLIVYHIRLLMMIQHVSFHYKIILCVICWERFFTQHMVMILLNYLFHYPRCLPNLWVVHLVYACVTVKH